MPMNTENTIKQIARIPLFEGLPREHHQDLSAIVSEKTFSRGQIIFSEGDDAQGFYVVNTGRVKIFKLSMEGREQILHIIEPREPFGEVPVFTGQRFPANAEAMEKSLVFLFPRAAFVDLIKRNPSLSLNMLAILSKRLHQFTALIDDLSLKEVPGRLAAYLLYLSDQKQKTEDLMLDITKTQLAALLGTIPETLSRILGKLGRQGLIDIEGSRIRILDRETLENLVEAGGKLV
jgi:CRP/FNR family transcriptional regulator